jgi:hypothetical protein
MAAAMTYVFRHAGRLGIGTAHYSLWGSSAGARMAAGIGSHGSPASAAATCPGLRLW